MAKNAEKINEPIYEKYISISVPDNEESNTIDVDHDLLIEHDFPTFSEKTEKTLSEKYRELRDFLENYKLKLIDDIDLLYYDFEITFDNYADVSQDEEVDHGDDKYFERHFFSTLEVKEFFEKHDFSVSEVLYRNYKKENDPHPILKNKKLLTGGKDFFMVRLSYNSEFFEKEKCEIEKESMDETCCDFSNNLDLKPSEKERLIYGKIIKKHNPCRLNYFSVSLLIAFLFLAIGTIFFIFRPTSEHKKNENIPELSKVSITKEIIVPTYYDLTFQTENGTKQFFNAKYFKTSFFNYTVESYKENAFTPYRTDIFPKKIVKSITKIEHITEKK